jgi:hypothetical protein
METQIILLRGSMTNIQVSEWVMDLVFAALEEGLMPLRSGQELHPFLLLLTKGGYVLQRFNGATMRECLEKAYVTLQAQDENTRAYALVYDGLVTVDERDYDAVIVEAAEREQVSGVRFVQRYQPKAGNTPLFTIGTVALLGAAEQHLAS